MIIRDKIIFSYRRLTICRKQGHFYLPIMPINNDSVDPSFANCIFCDDTRPIFHVARFCTKGAKINNIEFEG